MPLTVTIPPSTVKASTCPKCAGPTVAETVARDHRIPVTFCDDCNLVVDLDVPLHGHTRGCKGCS